MIGGPLASGLPGTIAGIGVDIVEIDRIAGTLERYGERFERKVFTEREIRYCRYTPRRTAERYAARFAAREAFAKAIGTGIRNGFRWREVAVGKEPTGRPYLLLTGRTAERYGSLRFHLSLSHTDNTAIAIVIAEHPPDPPV